MTKTNRKRTRLLAWIFPPERDFLGLLRDQASLAMEAAIAFRDWIESGDARLADRVAELEDEADACRKTLGEWLSEAFVTPMNREDLDRMSRSIDEVVDYLHSTVEEIRVFAIDTDDVIRDMAAQLLWGVRDLCRAVELLPGDRAGASDYAIAAKRSENEMEKIYREGVKDLCEGGDVREILLRREIYRHLSNAADRLDEAADELWMAILKHA